MKGIMKVRKKPVEVEAFQWTAKLFKNLIWKSLPDWLKAEYDKGNIIMLARGMEIKTLEGWIHASENDWIIKGVNGEIYPCKPDIFEKTYDILDQ